MLIALSLVAALILGGLLALVTTPVAGLVLALLLLTAGAVAQRADEGPRRAIGVTLLLALLAGGSLGTLLVIDVVDAVTTTAGPPQPPDPDALASAEAKLGGLSDSTAFRLELTEAELQAVVQQGVAANPDQPIHQVDLRLRGATRDLAFTAAFKSGGVEADGTATVTAVDGGVDVALGPLRFGRVQVPAVARGAIASLLGAVTDLNTALQEQGAVVQSVDIDDGRMVVIGTRQGTPLSGGQLLESIRAQAAGAADSVPVPPEVLGPGTVDSTDAPGDPMVLAIGDSLAAGIGVDRPRDAAVSRFHRAVTERDGRSYGLRNLGVPGETSGTLLVSGQLDAAEEALNGRAAAYVLVVVGANDLLGHLESPDCADDLRTAVCQQRVEQTLVSYRRNLERLLDRLVPASDGATVILLQFYNPFSLGIGGGDQEAESSAAVARMNAVAADVAGARGVLIADGFTPMQGTTAVTTAMLAPQPDIHPNAIGYDVLATAMVQALGP